MLELLHNKTVQAIAGWLAVLTAAYTALGRLTPEWFGQLTWPQAILAAIGAALVTSLALSIALLAGAFAFRLIRPLSAPSSASAFDTDSPLASDGRTLTERLNKIETTERALDEAHTQLGERLGRITKANSEYREKLEERLRKLGVQIENLGKRVDGVSSEIGRAGEGTRQQIISLYDALNAVHQRERLGELSTQIEAGAAALREPTEFGTQLDENGWEAWETKQRAWRSLLDEWCAIANCYYGGISQKILLVTEEDLMETGVAKVTQFHTPEAFNIYKAFNKRYFNWCSWLDEARNAVTRVAISGTAQSRPVN